VRILATLYGVNGVMLFVFNAISPVQRENAHVFPQKPAPSYRCRPTRTPKAVLTLRFKET
jgi:hypothetical protein